MRLCNPFQKLALAFSVATGLAFLCSVVLAQEPIEHLSILVPAERGGGWDLTAKAMADALVKSGSVRQVDIEYSPGAGGLIGLAQFISSKRGQGNALMVGGMFTVGAAVQNHSAVSLSDTTPLARLTLDHAVIAVPTSSSIRSAEDLFEAVASDPGSISWVGGSRAGVDELNLFEIARALGIPPTRLHYAGLPGGGEVGEALSGGQYDVGISGYSEFEHFVRDGRLRLVAAALDEDAAELGITSLARLGMPLEHVNWRGVFAPPEITDEEKQALLEVIADMAASPAWRSMLNAHHWGDSYLAGEEFTQFVSLEQQRIELAIASMKEDGPAETDIISKVLARRYAWALALAALSVVLIAVLLYQRLRSHRIAEGLQHAFEEATGKAIRRREELEKAMAGIHAQIEADFDKWNLTAAEREIALLLLKGLRLKEIADARGTSERTVRQQAQAVYKKAGLEGRSELAAFFIEDFMQSFDANAAQGGQ